LFGWYVRFTHASWGHVDASRWPPVSGRLARERDA
jgi:hypothetical protein